MPVHDARATPLHLVVGARVGTSLNKPDLNLADIQSLEVYIQDVSNSTLPSIQKLRKLQYLGLDFILTESSNIELLLHFSDSSQAFCGLQRLGFSGTLESITVWLPSFISPSPTKFTAEIRHTEGEFEDDDDHDSSSKKQCYEFCETLVKHARPPSRLEHPADLDTSFDDQTLIKWATAWSNLKSFKVRSSCVNSITLSGVKTLLELCRNLKDLGLAFDATETDSVPEIPTTASVTKDTLRAVMDVLGWVFLDIWDVKSRRIQIADDVVSEQLPHCLEQLVLTTVRVKEEFQ
ncbi:hypothetical protein M413DRAFT_30136 [Hebeloma cylindrosporum]|uniref:Uncharacterized protein n=1 Tax=Hebeloma cylindrosporum TaxID=76867 RepID=A0A0C2XLL4_HEBCY|nr:hypothetical protein M413DRAFT_30136 [Hebeloma cylindrosporum h7]